MTSEQKLQLVWTVKDSLDKLFTKVRRDLYWNPGTDDFEQAIQECLKPNGEIKPFQVRGPGQPKKLDQSKKWGPTGDWLPPSNTWEGLEARADLVNKEKQMLTLQD